MAFRSDVGPLDIACPDCVARRGEECLNLLTGRRRIERDPHDSRVRKAQSINDKRRIDEKVAARIQK